MPYLVSSILPVEGSGISLILMGVPWGVKYDSATFKMTDTLQIHLGFRSSIEPRKQVNMDYAFRFLFWVVDRETLAERFTLRVHPV